MPRVVITENAAGGLKRCRQFLASNNPQAAIRAAQAIETALVRLETTPQMGRPFAPNPALRELIIPFGGAGYIALYAHETEIDAVIVLAFRHQREASYE